MKKPLDHYKTYLRMFEVTVLQVENYPAPREKSTARTLAARALGVRDGMRVRGLSSTLSTEFESIDQADRSCLDRQTFEDELVLMLSTEKAKRVGPDVAVLVMSDGRTLPYGEEAPEGARFVAVALADGRVIGRHDKEWETAVLPNFRRYIAQEEPS